MEDPLLLEPNLFSDSPHRAGEVEKKPGGAPRGGAELRAVERVRCLLPAKAVFNGGDTTVDGVLRNISNFGGLFCVIGATQLPSEFVLSVPKKNQQFNVAVKWTNGMNYGLAFASQDGERDTGMQAILDRLTKLEREVNLLRGRLQELDKFAGL